MAVVGVYNVDDSGTAQLVSLTGLTTLVCPHLPAQTYPPVQAAQLWSANTDQAIMWQGQVCFCVRVEWQHGSVCWQIFVRLVAVPIVSVWCISIMEGNIHISDMVCGNFFGKFAGNSGQRVSDMGSVIPVVDS